VNKQEIIQLLRTHYIFSGSGQRNYKDAKEIISKQNLSPKEYERAIKIITNYLKI
jgi:hypothetical protein